MPRRRRFRSGAAFSELATTEDLGGMLTAQIQVTYNGGGN